MKLIELNRDGEFPPFEELKMGKKFGVIERLLDTKSIGGIVYEKGIDALDEIQVQIPSTTHIDTYEKGMIFRIKRGKQTFGLMILYSEIRQINLLELDEKVPHPEKQNMLISGQLIISLVKTDIHFAVPQKSFQKVNKFFNKKVFQFR